MPDSQFHLDLARFLDHIQESAPETAQQVAEAVRPHAPVGKDRADGTAGGGLRDGLAAKVVELRPNGLTLALTSDKPYAVYVVKGTPPHPIDPKHMIPTKDGGERLGYLRWAVGGSGGAEAVVFGQHVDHPGTTANPFYHEADDEIRGIFRDLIRQAMQAART